MKLCPYCGKTLVKDALACKHCGEWLEDISDYLKMRGSIYADTDSMSLSAGVSKPVVNQPKEKKINCVFCEFSKVLSEQEITDKKYTCPECRKMNIVSGSHIDDILKNVSIGWGWLILTVYFVFSIQKYLNTLDDELQMGITFGLSLIVLLTVYFLIRRFILKERYEKKNKLGNIYNASLVSGIVSTFGVVIFIFAFHFAYSYSGFQTDKKETNYRVMHFRAKINEISEKQKNINELIAKHSIDKKDAGKKTNLIDDYINLNNEEKKYTDSIYKALEDSEYYTNKIDNKKKIKDANLLVNKIIVYKIMSARNLKHFFLTGDNNALKAVEELNSEIAKLNKEYSSKYQNLLIED